MKTHDMEERLRSHYRQSARRAQPDPAAKARALAAVADAARRHSPAPAAAPAPAPSGARAATPPQVPATAQAPAHRPVAPDAPAPAHQRRKAPAAAPAGGFAHFAFEQARFVRTWVWAAQAGILALTAAGSLLAPTGEAASCVAAVAAALSPCWWACPTSCAAAKAGWPKWSTPASSISTRCLPRAWSCSG